jgi:hypothetical protein
MNEKIKNRINLLMESGTDHLAQAVALLSGYRAALENPAIKNPHSKTCSEGWEWACGYEIGSNEKHGKDA